MVGTSPIQDAVEPVLAVSAANEGAGSVQKLNNPEMRINCVWLLMFLPVGAGIFQEKECVRQKEVYRKR